MSRLVTAALTIVLVVYSYFAIKTSVPLLTARMLTHSGSTVPVAQVTDLNLYLFFFMQLFLAALLLAAPYVAADNIHFGAWCLSRYTPQQLDRILPSLRELMSLLALLVSFYFAACIYWRIHQAQSQTLLPADWLGHMARTEMQWLAALLVACGLVIYRYVRKFDRIAREEITHSDASAL